MRRTALFVLGLVVLVGIVAASQLTSGQASPKVVNQDTELPVTPVYLCSSYVPCPQSTCPPPCDRGIEEDTYDLGVPCCVDNGQIWPAAAPCPGGQTVHTVTSSCGGDGCPSSFTTNVCQ